jgi:hypothetical protein
VKLFKTNTPATEGSNLARQDITNGTPGAHDQALTDANWNNATTADADRHVAYRAETNQNS